MKRRTLSIIFAMLVVLGITVLAIFSYLRSDYEKALETPNSDSTDTVLFEVIQGESLDTIVPSLVNQGLLREEHSNYFIYYLRSNDLTPKIQAGTFNIPKNLTPIELAQTLKQANGQSVWVTITEGKRLSEIAEIISQEFSEITKQSFIDAAYDETYINSLGLNVEGLNSLEGFLFPDRYLLPPESSSQEIISIMVDNFNNKVNYDYTYEDIILASLIEREAVDSEDRRIISDILQKRLEEQWLLQVDATLLYYHDDWEHIITVADKEREHVYNTYKFHGLPPQPICSPGLDSIASVFEPESNQYYYYIHDNDRNPHYSRTLEEHEQKVQKYLR